MSTNLGAVHFPNSQGLLLSGIFEFQSLAVKGSNGEITGLCGLL